MTVEEMEECQSVFNYEEENIELYSKYGTGRSNEYMYHCVLCGITCCIDRSMSNRGHRLICNRCSITKFNTLHDAFEWVYEDRKYGQGA